MSAMLCDECIRQCSILGVDPAGDVTESIVVARVAGRKPSVGACE